MYKIIDNFLDDKLYNDLYDLAISTKPVRESRDFWTAGLYKESGVEQKNSVKISSGFVNLNDDNPECIKKFQEYIKMYMLPIYKDSYKITSMFYNWNESNIFWHDDGSHRYGITYYLNKEWEADWGGELLLQDSTFVQPKPNRIIFIKAPYNHKTSLVAEGAPDRLTIQTFVSDKDKDKIY